MNNKQLKNLKDRLWEGADQLRANSGLKSTEYATPILGLIFLRFAQSKYSQFETAINAEYEKTKGSRAERPIHEIAVEKCGYYLPQEARFDYTDDNEHLPKSSRLFEWFCSLFNGGKINDIIKDLGVKKLDLFTDELVNERLVAFVRTVDNEINRFFEYIEVVIVFCTQPAFCMFPQPFHQIEVGAVWRNVDKCHLRFHRQRLHRRAFLVSGVVRHHEDWFACVFMRGFFFEFAHFGGCNVSIVGYGGQFL